jgi:hypothetical protein
VQTLAYSAADQVSCKTYQQQQMLHLVVLQTFCS